MSSYKRLKDGNPWSNGRRPLCWRSNLVNNMPLETFKKGSYLVVPPFFPIPPPFWRIFPIKMDLMRNLSFVVCLPPPTKNIFESCKEMFFSSYEFLISPL